MFMLGSHRGGADPFLQVCEGHNRAAWLQLLRRGQGGHSPSLSFSLCARGAPRGPLFSRHECLAPVGCICGKDPNLGRGAVRRSPGLAWRKALPPKARASPPVQGPCCPQVSHTSQARLRNTSWDSQGIWGLPKVCQSLTRSLLEPQPAPRDCWVGRGVGTGPARGATELSCLSVCLSLSHQAGAEWHQHLLVHLAPHQPIDGRTDGGDSEEPGAQARPPGTVCPAPGSG